MLHIDTTDITEINICPTIFISICCYPSHLYIYIYIYRCQWCLVYWCIYASLGLNELLSWQINLALHITEALNKTLREPQHPLTPGKKFRPIMPSAYLVECTVPMSTSHIGLDNCTWYCYICNSIWKSNHISDRKSNQNTGDILQPWNFATACLRPV